MTKLNWSRTRRGHPSDIDDLKRMDRLAREIERKGWPPELATMLPAPPLPGRRLPTLYPDSSLNLRRAHARAIAERHNGGHAGGA